MDDFTKQDLEKALSAVMSMIKRSENVQKKLKEGTSQASLTRNRLKALYISSTLITKELGENLLTNDYTKDDLAKALPPIISTIKKCEKIQEKSSGGTSQSTATKNILRALYISSTLITRELNKIDVIC